MGRGGAGEEEFRKGGRLGGGEGENGEGMGEEEEEKLLYDALVCFVHRLLFSTQRDLVKKKKKKLGGMGEVFMTQIYYFFFNTFFFLYQILSTKEKIKKQFLSQTPLSFNILFILLKKKCFIL